MKSLIAAAFAIAFALPLAATAVDAAHQCTPACKKGEVCTMNSKGETRCKKQEIKGSEECKGDPLCGIRKSRSGSRANRILTR